MSAPAICVVVVVDISDSVVEAIRLRNEVSRAFSTRANGRYLLASVRLL